MYRKIIIIFFYLSIRYIMNKNINANNIGINRGDVIHHQDQLIIAVSFKIKKIIKITMFNPIILFNIFIYLFFQQS